MTTSAGKSGLRGCLIVFAVVIAWITIANITALWWAAKSASKKIYTFSGPTMGTRYTVRVVDRKLLLAAPSASKKLQSKVNARLDEINARMSTYDADSELSRFNRSTGSDWFSVSDETASVVELALQVARDSGGVFDPTVGPLVNLWGFGPGKKRAEPPNESAIAAMLDAIGYDKLEVRRNRPALRKSMSHLQVDLSAIAKGYAVDVVSKLLAEQGFRNTMVEIGGEVRARGTKPGGIAWRIGIEEPDVAGRGIQQTVELRDRSLATSGDYRNFFRHAKNRYSHTIDPTIGRPVKHSLTAVTVLMPSCAEADAWATALLVMGSARGYDWCAERDVAALFLIRDEASPGKIRELATPQFQAITSPQVTAR